VIEAWLAGCGEFLERHGLGWNQVLGVGVAVPGPLRSPGVLDVPPNLPPEFVGWNAGAELGAALARAAGRPVPLVLGNDGNMGGVAEAQRVRGSGHGGVVMLAPGSGLGGAYVAGDGLPLAGDFLAGMEVGHMPAPLHVLDARPYRCGCGRTWGCFEVYTSLAGLRCRATLGTRLRRRATRRSNVHWRCAGWPNRGICWRWSCSISRPGRSGCWLRTLRWRWIRRPS
jgi:glucokinase